MDDVLQYPDNSLHDREARSRAIFEEYRRTVLELAEHGHRVILVYPIPEVGWNVPDRLRQLLQGAPTAEVAQLLAQHPVTTSSAVYRERARDSFALLDGISHPNVYRVYPDRLFCDTRIPGRCVTHDDAHAFYRDDDHLSQRGARMLLDAIVALPPFAEPPE